LENIALYLAERPADQSYEKFSLSQQLLIQPSHACSLLHGKY